MFSRIRLARLSYGQRAAPRYLLASTPALLDALPFAAAARFHHFRMILKARRHMVAITTYRPDLVRNILTL
jgi:hypothetical protein